MANPYGKPSGGFLEDYSLLAGAGAAFQGFAKGLQDAEDRKLKQQEFEAKMKTQAAQIEKEAAEAAVKRRQATPEYQRSEKLKDFGAHGQRPIFDQSGNVVDWKYDEDYKKMQADKLEAAKIAAGNNANKTTEGENASAGYVRRMEGAEKKYQNLIAGGFDPTTFRAQTQTKLGGPLEVFKDPKVKQYQQVVRDFASAVLRKESGAAISPKEFSEVEAQYFPQAGDTPDVLAQKSESRSQVMSNFKTAAGKAYVKTPSVPVGGGLMPKGKLKPGLVKGDASAAAPKTTFKTSEIEWAD